MTVNKFVTNISHLIFFLLNIPLEFVVVYNQLVVSGRNDSLHELKSDDGENPKPSE